MDQVDYKSLNIHDKLEYINKMLREGYSQTKLEPIIGISRKTMSKEFKAIGYEFNKTTKQFESIVEIVEADIMHNKATPQVKPLAKKQDSSNLVVGGKQVNNTLIEELMLNYTDMNNKLDEVYRWYQESSNKVVVEDCKFVVDDFEGELVSRSFKLYDIIQKDFADFCKANNRYKVQDILCQFIKEGLDKYK